MTKVQNGEKMLPKVSTSWVGCTNVTDNRRQQRLKRNVVTFGQKPTSRVETENGPISRER